MTPLQRVVTYARVSDPRGRQEPENQAAQMRTFIAKRSDWELIHEYQDMETGSKEDRRQFQRLFADAKRSEFDILVFWSLDRFSREGVRETLNHLNRLTECRVSWLSFTEQYLDTCGIFKDAVLAILAVMAKQERLRISERIRSGLALARSKGVKIGGHCATFDKERFRRACRAEMPVNEIAAMFAMSQPTVRAYRRTLCPELPPLKTGPNFSPKYERNPPSFLETHDNVSVQVEPVRDPLAWK